ncbi:CPBP family intramembrane glutamic endopeptidase [Actinomadura sp. BRA 177]|uniref:CPBP family intramembrane glutamic endopeptidase n=1 Tax=Actinomadura sp. BRA 177 TaxID=2745202 RepID=UPI0015956ED8|nr:CPBP family intramembrane glutamic endopeptidase [Actinomadura sp. BRA 177]NVI93195.1 CPBP family intramembrane metalloprotease [Actinomadura sp. BRA 177]
MRLLFQLLAVGAVALIGGNITAQVKDNDVLTLAGGLVTAVLTLLVYGWVVRRTERRAPVEVAVKGAAPGLFWGLLIGVGLFGAVIANIAFLGSYEVEGKGSVMGAVGVVGFMAGAAVTEEVLFRGILFRFIEGRFGTWLALLVTAVLFGLWHLPTAGPWGAVAVALEAGGMLAAAYAVTRSLWLPIGLHFGWNFAAAGIFSTEVSGNGENEGLLRGVTSGSKLVTGGEVGPEGGLYAVVFGLLMTVVLLWVAHRRGRLQGPRNRTARHAAAATAAQ